MSRNRASVSERNASGDGGDVHETCEPRAVELALLLVELPLAALAREQHARELDGQAPHDAPVQRDVPVEIASPARERLGVGELVRPHRLVERGRERAIGRRRIPAGEHRVPALHRCFVDRLGRDRVPLLAVAGRVRGLARLVALVVRDGVVELEGLVGRLLVRVVRVGGVPVGAFRLVVVARHRAGAVVPARALGRLARVEQARDLDREPRRAASERALVAEPRAERVQLARDPARDVRVERRSRRRLERYRGVLVGPSPVGPSPVGPSPVGPSPVGSSPVDPEGRTGERGELADRARGAAGLGAAQPIEVPRDAVEPVRAPAPRRVRARGGRTARRRAASAGTRSPCTSRARGGRARARRDRRDRARARRSRPDRAARTRARRPPRRCARTTRAPRPSRRARPRPRRRRAPPAPPPPTPLIGPVCVNTGLAVRGSQAPFAHPWPIPSPRCAPGCSTGRGPPRAPAGSTPTRPNGSRAPASRRPARCTTRPSARSSSGCSAAPASARARC